MRLSNPHRKIDKWIRDNPRRVDFMVGLIISLACLPLSTAIGASYSFAATLSLMAISLTQTVPLMFRRRYPWASTVIIASGHLLQLGFAGLLLPSQIAVPVMVYTMATYGKRWQSLATLGLGILGAVLATCTIFNNSTYAPKAGGFVSFDMIVSFVGLSLVVALSWTFGDLARNRHVALKALRDYADRLEKERLIERELAASDERNHIAREMHDIVAHSLSVMITQADGARYAAPKDPQLAIDTLRTISDTGRSSLREMRRLLGILRKDNESDNRPLPTLGSIPELVEHAKTSNLHVELLESGFPRRSLPAGAELAAYRCVQEALTNVIKHAGIEAAALVELSWSKRGLSIRVEDDGAGSSKLTVEGVGHGLNGMRERVNLYDGSCHAANGPNGGFVVSVFIPYSED